MDIRLRFFIPVSVDQAVGKVPVRPLLDRSNDVSEVSADLWGEDAGELAGLE